MSKSCASTMCPWFKICGPQNGLANTKTNFDQFWPIAMWSPCYPMLQDVSCLSSFPGLVACRTRWEIHYAPRTNLSFFKDNLTYKNTSSWEKKRSVTWSQLGFVSPQGKSLRRKPTEASWLSWPGYVWSLARVAPWMWRGMRSRFW